MRRQLTQGLFIALLLVSQAVLSTHGVDFNAHTGDETCVLCLLVSGVDHSPTAEFVFLVQPVECRSALYSPFTRPDQADNAPYRSRAPPVTHSSIG